MAKRTAKSIVSTLTTLVVATQWTLWFMFIFAPLTAIGAPFLPLRVGPDPANGDAEGTTFFIGLMFDEGMTRPAVILESIIVMVMAGAALYGLHHFRHILRNVSSGAAFVRANGLRLRKAGYAAVTAQLAIYGLWIVSLILGATFGLDFDGRVIILTPIPWVGILGIFVLSTIFLEGAQIKEEQDLTV